MTPDETLLVHAALPQDLTVHVRGPDVLQLEAHAPPDAEAPFPDLVERFAEAARLGFFAGPNDAPWTGRAEVLAKSDDLAQREQRWTVRLAGVDPGAFRILWNLLHARDLEAVSLRTAAPPGPGAGAVPLLDIPRLAYPPAPTRLSFEVIRGVPLKAHKDRGVQVTFQRPPPDEVMDELIRALERWTDLVLLGAYPEPGMDPKESGCFPEAPFQLDEITADAAFPEAFVADDAAFAAVVSHAALLHHAGHPIHSVVIR